MVHKLNGVLMQLHKQKRKLSMNRYREISRMYYQEKGGKNTKAYTVYHLLGKKEGKLLKNAYLYKYKHWEDKP